MTSATTEGPNRSEFGDIPIDWINGTDLGGYYQKRRLVGYSDKVRASDINDLRMRLEELIGHSHDFSYTSGGGGTTTTCG